MHSPNYQRAVRFDFENAKEKKIKKAHLGRVFNAIVRRERAQYFLFFAALDPDRGARRGIQKNCRVKNDEFQSAPSRSAAHGRKR